MPGIAGIIHKTPAASGSASIQDMVTSMVHESHHVSGTVVEPALGLVAGWVVHRDSFADCLPVWNETRDICLLFTGEHFGDASELKSLKASGHQCTEANASYLVHLYEEQGTRCFERLNGFFSGLIIDLREKKIILFNDRYGLQRVYVHETTDAFYFASEAKALLKVLPQLRRLDLQSLGEYFSCGCALQNRSLFVGVSLLPGASAWTFAPQQAPRKQTYFERASWENQSPLGDEEYYEQLKDTFVRVLPRYFRGNVAMSLTGGLDGRMIMAWATQPAGSLPCYTFNGPYRDCADVRIARRVAKACGQSHQSIPVGDAFLAEFPALAEKNIYFSDGAMDVTGAAEIYVNRLARQIAPIRLTGNYGSEIIRSNVAFRPSSLMAGCFDPAFVPVAAKATDVYVQERQGSALSFIAWKQVPWHHYARLSVEQSQLTVRSPFLDNELVALMFRAPASAAAALQPSLRLIGEGNPTLGRIPTDRGITWPARPLMKVRRQFEEFLIKAEYAYDYGMPQKFAPVDRVLSPLHLERLFLGRQKFLHFRIWYKKQLADYVKSVLLDPRSRSRAYVKGAMLEPMVMDHIKGNRNYTVQIHKLLSVELLHRTLLES